MKSLLFLGCLLAAVTVNAQTTWGLTPSCPQKVYTTDTARIFAQLSASDGVGTISFAQLSGPVAAVLINPVPTWTSGQQLMQTVQVVTKTPGLYVFKVTGISKGGTSGSTLDSLTVAAAPVQAPPRTLTGASFQIVNGIWTLTGAIYSDGAHQ